MSSQRACTSNNMTSLRAMDIIARCSISLILIAGLIALSTAMRIESLAIKPSPLVHPGTLLTLHCIVSPMDFSRFVQFGKLVPTSLNERVIFTTNENIERPIRDIDRYSVRASKVDTTSDTAGTDERTGKFDKHGVRVSSGVRGDGQETEEGEIERYDFVFRIDEVRLEDAGVYYCTIPSLNITKFAALNIYADPTSIHLYVDDLERFDMDRVTLNDVGPHTLRCTTHGSYPHAQIKFTLSDDDVTLNADSTTHHVLTKHLTSSPKFLAHTTYMTTAVVHETTVNYLHANKPIKCSAHVIGSSANKLVTRFIPTFSGSAPQFICARHVIADPQDDYISIKCVISASPVIDDMYMYYYVTLMTSPPSSPSPPPAQAMFDYTAGAPGSDGGNIPAVVVDNVRGDASDDAGSVSRSYDSRQLVHPRGFTRPTNGESRLVGGGGGDLGGASSPKVLDDGVFNEAPLTSNGDSDIMHADDHGGKVEGELDPGREGTGTEEERHLDEDKDLVFSARQAGNETYILLRLKTKNEDVFRDYFIVASNKYGTATHIMSVRQEALFDAVQDAEPLNSSSSRTFQTSSVSFVIIMAAYLACLYRFLS